MIRDNIMRRCLAMAMSLVMAAGMCLTAHAEEISRTGWTAVFTGSAIETNFRPSDAYAALCELQPGDSGSLRIDLRNDSDEYVQWYVSNDTLQTLEDTRASAKDGGYTYKLAYTSNGAAGSSDAIAVSDRTVVLFESDAVGGDSSGGLYDATDALDEYIQLCSMAPGGSGYVVLDVGLDGETQGNGYQSTLAALRINFAVDTVPPEYVEIPGEPTTVTVKDPPRRVEIPGDPVYVIGDPDVPLSDIPQYTTVPQTSDTLKAVLWSTAAMLAGCGTAAIIIIAKKRREKEDVRA